MKKKALALFLATMTAASLFAGCGNSSSSSSSAGNTAKTEEKKEETEEKAEEAAEETKEETKEEATEEAAEEDTTLEAGEEKAEDAADAADKAADTAEDAAEEATDAAADAAEEATDAAAGAADKAADAVEEAEGAVEEAADAAADAAEDATDAAADAAEEATDAVEEAADAAADAAEEATDAAADAAEGAEGAVEEAADAADAAEDATDAAADAVEDAEGAVEEAADAAADAAEEATDAAADAAEDAKDAVEGAAEEAADAAEEATDAAADAVEDVKDAVEDAAEEATDAAADAAEEAEGAVEEAAEDAEGAVADAKEAVEDAATEAAAEAEEVVEEAADAAAEVEEAVEEAVDEAAAEAEDVATEAADAAEEVAEDAADAAADAAGAVAAAGAGVTEADLPTAPDFDPNPDYDKWTVVEYTIEDIQADLVCTVSAKEDNSEFYLETNFYGDDQMTRTTYDGKEYNVEEDKTGFMKGDTPAILDKAQEQDLWVYFDGAAAADDAAAEETEEAADAEEAAEEAPAEEAAEEQAPAEEAAEEEAPAEEAAEDKAADTEEVVEEAADEAADAAGAAAEDAAAEAEEAAADAEEAVDEAAADAEEAVEETADAADEAAADAEEAVEETADAADEAAADAEEAVEETADAADEAAADAEEAVEETADAADEAAADTEEAVDKAVEEAAAEAEEAVEETAEAADEAAAEAEDAVEEAAADTEEAVEEATEEVAADAEEVVEEAAGAAAATAAAVTLYQSEIYPDGGDVTFAPAAYNEAAPDWTEYNNLIAEIKSETDTEVRLAKMHQAEDLLMATGAVIPIYYYNDLYLQKTDVEGIYSNLFGFKYFQFASVPRDVLKVNLASEPAKIDPALNSSVDGACIDVNLFAGLYTYDEEGNLQPDLADHDNPYEVSDDGLVYTFHLQEGLKWSDGSDLTANDFVYAWKRAADPMTAADYAYMFESIAGYEDNDLQVEAPDDLTLVVTLKAPCAYFLDLAAFPAYLPVPQAQVEAASDWETNPGSWASEAGFVTNGAYTVSEWKHEESMTFKKNPNYYRADEVTIEEIDFMLSADDTAIYAAYQSGDLDFADTVPTNEIEAIKENEDFHVVDNLGTYYAAFNVNSPIFEGKTVDQAIAMRKAFALLIDRDYIIENIGQTEQKVATSYIPEGMADGNGGVFKENTDAYTFPDEEAVGYYPAEWSEEGVDEARALLEYAGFEFTEDGVLSDETPINITYLTNESTGHVAIAEAMQQDFAELGINMSIEQREWNVFLDERKNGQFDFAREGWLADFNDPINMLEMWTTQSGNNDCQFGKDPSAAPVEEEAAE